MEQLPRLVPPTVNASAVRRGLTGAAPGPRFFVGVLFGLLWLGPAWWDLRFAAVMLVWDGLLALAWLVDWMRLAEPHQITVCRIWSEPLSLSSSSRVDIQIASRGKGPLWITVEDDLPPSLLSNLPRLELQVAGAPFPAPPNAQNTSAAYSVYPHQRGDIQAGTVSIRYRSALGLAERWAQADLRQTVRVYPNLDEARRHTLYLMRSRQIELEKRYRRQRGPGRDFESLREYRDGDEPRDICWSATARRAKLVTRVYRVERSQQVIIVLDQGRLLQARVRPLPDPGSSILESPPAGAAKASGEHAKSKSADLDKRAQIQRAESPAALTKLDFAVTAALSLAQVALYSGDSVGLLAYGRTVRARLGAGRGATHLRALLEQLAMAQGELVEADHSLAASLLLSGQKRRSLIVWLTDLAETAATPEVIESAARLLRQHLVLFVAMGQPELAKLAAQRPATAEAMYQGMAAQEMVNRREILLRNLQQQGALTVELPPGRLASGIVNQYLEIKERSLL